MKLKAVEGTYLVKLDKVEDNDGTFVIPKDSRKIPQRGTVIGINWVNKHGLSEGQVIFLPPNAGYKIEHNGEEYYSVSDREIIAKLENK